MHSPRTGLRRSPRAATRVAGLCLVLVAVRAGAASSTCPSIAERFKPLLGIAGDFDTRLRVERKSTNSEAQATSFLSLVKATVRPELGEAAEMRDRPSTSDKELVTATIYPFARRVQNTLEARIRIREYGERPRGTSDRFHSTSGDFVSFEIKAKTAQAGVVVKPILKVSKSALAKLLKDRATLARHREELLAGRLGDPKNDPAVVREALDTLDRFYETSAALGEPMVADAIEYSREAWVVKLFNQATGKLHSVQLTFDRAVSLRRGVDPTASPWDATARDVSASYPVGASAVVVVEMKSDLVVDAAFRERIGGFAEEAPGYVSIRRAYEDLQREPASGFEADSGKAAHLASERWE